MMADSDDISADMAVELERALYYHNRGSLQRAERLYRQILVRFPEHPDVLHLLGLVLHQSGNHTAAVAAICQAIQQKSDNPFYYSNLGVVYYTQNRFGPAVSCYHKALELKPDYADAYNNLANVLRKQGDLYAAADCYRKALDFHSDDVVVLNNLGQVYRQLGRINAEIACYQRALSIDPDHAQTYLNQGNALQYQGELDQSIDCYQKALAKKPDFAMAYNNCGTAFLTQGKLQQSRLFFQKAIEYNPQYADAYNNLGNVFQNQGRYEQAVLCFEKTLRIKPDHINAHCNLLYALHYMPSAGPRMLFESADKWWRDHGRFQERLPHRQRTRRSSERLKIGYVSPDFREHSVSYFFKPLLEFRDRNSFEVYCYSETKRRDHITEQTRGLSDHWRDTAWLNDVAVAERIRRDGIDILVDLAGHTSGNRLMVFARKPAPVQITWLGYPGTTGLPVIDYRLTDDIADPPGEADQYHSETLIRLPNGFLCYRPPESAPNVSELPASQSGRITFGSFNNMPKINERVIGLWSHILNQTPGSCLKLKSKQFADESARLRLWQLFSMRGITSERIILLPRISSTAGHLAQYGRIDIGLDPFPYNGTTTTCEALWMGVPVITLRGNRHSARVGASILSRVGLTQMIAESEEQYVHIAVKLAQDLDQLAKLRAEMRHRITAAGLCDGKFFARTMEDMFHMVWQKRCQMTSGSE